MESLEYGPLTKQQIKDTLYDFLYSPVQKRFKLRLDTIILRNTLLGGHAHKSFHYKGIGYSCDTSAAPRKWNKLLPELRPQMDEYLADVHRINEFEVPFVLNYISQVLNASQSIQDYLRLLPECLHAPLQRMARTCPCRADRLTPDRIHELTRHNATPISLIKQRMVTNLLL